jgi:hypothetical protein
MQLTKNRKHWENMKTEESHCYSTGEGKIYEDIKSDNYPKQLGCIY